MGKGSVERNGSRRFSKRLERREVAALSAAALVVLLATAGALAATAHITQPAGTAGCISERGAGPCADGHGLDGPFSVAVSPDGKSVYVASEDSNAVVRLNRNTTTGALTQPAGTAGCISETGAGPCADGHGLDGPFSVAVSPDGRNVYVASGFTSAVVRLDRNPTTGALTQPAGTAGCISETGAGPCADGHGLDGTRSVAVSPDGKSVYAAAQGAVHTSTAGAVARLNRNPTTGALTQPAGTAGCISDPRSEGSEPCAEGRVLHQPRDVAVSPDGKSVYAVSGSYAVANFRRNTTGAITQPAGDAGCIRQGNPVACADGHGFRTPVSLAVSPDGKNVYVAGATVDNAVARLDRNTATGALTQSAGTAGCISETGAGRCADGHGLDTPLGVAVSPDGKSVYAASNTSDAVARLDRNTATGALTQPAGTAGCISETGAGPCADGHGLDGPFSVAVSPDAKSVYVTSAISDAVTRFDRAP